MLQNKQHELLKAMISIEIHYILEILTDPTRFVHILTHFCFTTCAELRFKLYEKCVKIFIQIARIHDSIGMDKSIRWIRIGLFEMNSLWRGGVSLCRDIVKNHKWFGVGCRTSVEIKSNTLPLNGISVCFLSCENNNFRFDCEERSSPNSVSIPLNG